MEPISLIIFGITSNLVQIKLIPALYDLAEKGLLPKKLSIIGIARRNFSKEEFQNHIHQALHTENKHHHHKINGAIANNLLRHFHYLQGNFEDKGEDNVYLKLKELLASHDQKFNNHLYYLATFPGLYETIFDSLSKFGLNQNPNGWMRLVIEKPLGHDLPSAKELDNLLHKHFAEEQIFRLDHYLGKETLQNILTFRFGNGIFEPLINTDYLDHIQVTAAEDIGIDKRGAYYDSVGALKDVGQNHELQLVTAVTMSAPSQFNNNEVTQERIKILSNLIPDSSKLVFGQYNGYLYEEKIAPDSKTETFFALRTEINNPRFKNVPIYIRAGKKMPRYATEINLVFKNPVNRLFSHLKLGNKPNVLTYRIFPNEGVALQILTKNPSHQWKLDAEMMQFCYTGGENIIPDAYEKLLYDAFMGDPTFFNDAIEVEAEWAFTDNLLEIKPPVKIYEPGTWGPKEANDLIEQDGRKWLEPNENFCSV